MVSGFQIDLDVSEWLLFGDGVNQLINSEPDLRRKYFEDIEFELSRRLEEQITLQNIDDTRTYRNSLRVELFGDDTDLSLRLGFDPVGSEADRLPIYWKTLEFGSKPIPLVPRIKLGAWGFRKLGNRLSGFNAATKIMKFGVTPHPILSRFFILGEPDGNIIGLMPETSTIIDIAGAKLIDGFVQIFQVISTGQVSALLMVPGKKPRFISPRGLV